MFRRKRRKDDVIRGQQEEIEAQNILIKWLLQRTEQQQSEEAGVNDSQTLSEMCHGHD